mgnify:CR=1 FL=1
MNSPPWWAIIFFRQGANMQMQNQSISIYLDSKPVACPRPRVTSGFAYMPKTYVKWKAEQKFKVMTQTNQRLITSPVALVLSFVFTRPKGMMRKADPTERIFKDTKPDIDNLCKSIMDVLQDCKIIKDDSQVVSVIAQKWYGAIIDKKKSEQNHIKIDIYPLKR